METEIKNIEDMYITGEIDESTAEAELEKRYDRLGTAKESLE